MKAYMGYSVEGGSSEGAVLVFAHNSHEARKLAFPFISDWFGETWIGTGVKLLKDSKHLFETEANKEKIAADIPHVIDSPTTCKGCELWGYELGDDGLCEDGRPMASCTFKTKPPRRGAGGF